MDKTLNKMIGDRIKTARLEKGLKQVDLAKAIDGTPALISNIENGGQSIQLIDLYKISKRLGKEVFYFLPNLEELSEAEPSISKQKEKLPPSDAAAVESLLKKIRTEE